MYFLYAALIGGFLTMMIMFNSEFALAGGQILSLIGLHAAGLGLVSVILPFRKEAKKKRAPYHLYLGGVVGVMIVGSNNVCFPALGASLMIAISMLGQATTAVFTDTTGFLGMQKYPLRTDKFIGFILMLGGIFFMIDRWQGNLFYIILALITGGLVLLNTLLNARLGQEIGSGKAIRVNYLAGFATIIIILPFSGFEFSSFKQLLTINPIYSLGGGFLGVLIIFGLNYVMPKIPTIYSMMLLFFGQIITGLLIDYFWHHLFSTRKLIGAFVVLLGVLLNVYFDKRQKKLNTQSIPKTPTPLVKAL